MRITKFRSKVSVAGIQLVSLALGMDLGCLSPLQPDWLEPFALSTSVAPPTSEQAKSSERSKNALEPGELPSDLQAFVDASAGLPPEFGADILLRIVESGSITDARTKINLLTKAYYLAESAQEAIKKRTISNAVDTESGYFDRAFQLNLDTLSLQSRVINALVSVQPTQARELFTEIRLPNLPTLSCDDSLIYDFSPFYQALANVMQSGFTAQEEREGRNLVFLTTYVTSVRHHAQFAPLARVLGGLALSPEQRLELTVLFSGVLDSLHGDPRSFGVINRWYDGLSPMLDLTLQLKKEGSSNLILLKALRAYLVSNFHAETCGDINTTRADNNKVPAAVSDFNLWIQETKSSEGITLIRAEEVSPAHIGPAAKDTYFWQSSPAKDFLARVKALRFGNKGEELTLSERQTFDWGQQLSAFLVGLESWQPRTGESTAAYFHQKCILYYALLAVLPSGPELQRVLGSYVKFLELNSIQLQSRIEWFFHFDDLFTAISHQEEEMNSQSLQTLLRSRDLTLYAYAQLEKWAPRKTPKVGV